MKKKDLHRGAGFLKSLLVCGAFALALLVFPSFKVSAADNCTISSKEAWADKELVEVHDLKINEKGSLTLSNVYLKVTGNVIANGDITLTNGSKLEVGGTYIHENGKLDVDSGCKINSKGDFRFQRRNAAGEYVTGKSDLYVKNGSIINIDKNLILDTSGNLHNLKGTFNIKGDISIKNHGSTPLPIASTFNLTSEKIQTISLPEDVVINTLTSVYPTVQVEKYINVHYINNDMTFTNPDKKIYISYGDQSCGTYTVTYDGDLILELKTQYRVNFQNSVGGTINVNGNLQALSGDLYINGNLNLLNSLLFEKENAAGEKTTVAAGFYPGKSAVITVGKDFIWNSTGNGLNIQGTMSLSGDYIDKKGISWNGTVRLLSKGQHVTILNGGYIKNLELAYPRSEYFFNPDECWKNIVEPVPTETPSTTNPAVNNDTTAKDEPVVEKLDSSQKQVKITKLTAAKKKVTVTFKKSKKISGYEVQYDTTKKFNNPTTKNVGAKKTSLTIKKLKSKTTYFVRIRSYKTTAEGKVYSTWSKVKKVKVK